MWASGSASRPPLHAHVSTCWTTPTPPDHTPPHVPPQGFHLNPLPSPHPSSLPHTHHTKQPTFPRLKPPTNGPQPHLYPFLSLHYIICLSRPLDPPPSTYSHPTSIITPPGPPSPSPTPYTPSHPAKRIYSVMNLSLQETNQDTKWTPPPPHLTSP